MSSDGAFIDEYIEWENNLDPVTEQLLPPWVSQIVHQFANNYRRAPHRSFWHGQHSKMQTSEWLIEKMYATSRKFIANVCMSSCRFVINIHIVAHPIFGLINIILWGPWRPRRVTTIWRVFSFQKTGTFKVNISLAQLCLWRAGMTAMVHRNHRGLVKTVSTRYTVKSDCVNSWYLFTVPGRNLMRTLCWYFH